MQAKQAKSVEMEEEESSVQSLLQRLQADLVLKFEELRVDNQSMKDRLVSIETKLGIETEGLRTGEKEEKEESQRDENIETLRQEGDQPEPDLDNAEESSAADNDVELDININGSDEEEEDDVEEDKPEKEPVKEVQLDRIPRSIYKGFCFRPIAGWKNSQGKFEISKEFVEIDEDGIELKISGFESSEEIAKINIPLRDVDKGNFIALYCYCRCNKIKFFS